MRYEGVSFRVWDTGFRVEGAGFGVEGPVFGGPGRGYGVGCRVNVTVVELSPAWLSSFRFLGVATRSSKLFLFLKQLFLFGPFSDLGFAVERIWHI